MKLYWFFLSYRVSCDKEKNMNTNGIYRFIICEKIVGPNIVQNSVNINEMILISFVWESFNGKDTKWWI